MERVPHREAIDTPSGLSAGVSRAIGIGLLLGAVTIVLVFVVGYSYFEGKKFAVLKENRYAVMPPARALEAQRVRTLLDSYAWVDQEQGTVRIPIDRAMELVALEAESR